MPPTASSTAPASRDEFLVAVRATELLTPQQSARAEAALPPTATTAAHTALALVTAGVLTRFQAERLLAGRPEGFHFGPYVIEEQIGRGSMGKVFRARHRTMNRSVAVKVLATELTQPQGARAAIERAAQAAAQLNHANIVTTYDINELGDRFYLVLEHVNGGSLAALVAERGALPVAEACELIRHAALGLEHAHARGMVHRDLKPKNLLVSRSKPLPVLKIADFGLARFNPSDDLDYVAPEQARHPQSADRRSDLYSLGAVLYFLLTGRPPFPGGSVEDKVRRHMWEEPAPIDRSRADVPAEVIALVRHLMAKAPEARPATAADVAARLGAITGAVEQAYLELTPAPVPGGAATPDPMSLSTSGSFPVPTPEAETSPWAALTVPNTSGLEYETKELPRLAAKKTAVSVWLLGGLAFGMLLTCMVAVGVIVRVAGK